MPSDRAKLRLALFDLPQVLPDDIYGAFDALLNMGKAEMDVDLYGYRFRLGILGEWEVREIWGKYSDYGNLVAIERIRKIDVLTQAIISITNDRGETKEFRDSADKQVLRSILLLLSPPVISELYKAYVYMEMKAENLLREQYGGFEEVAVSGFFPFGMEGHTSASAENEGRN